MTRKLITKMTTIFHHLINAITIRANNKKKTRPLLGLMAKIKCSIILLCAEKSGTTRWCKKSDEVQGQKCRAPLLWCKKSE